MSSCAQGQPPRNAIYYSKYMNNRINVSLFYSALNMADLAQWADLYFLSLPIVFVNTYTLERQPVHYVTTKLRFQQC